MASLWLRLLGTLGVRLGMRLALVVMPAVLVVRPDRLAVTLLRLVLVRAWLVAVAGMVRIGRSARLLPRRQLRLLR